MAGAGARALRLLAFAVLAFAAVEYLFGSILDAAPLRYYLHTPASTPAPLSAAGPSASHQHATRIDKDASLPWPKRTQARPSPANISDTNFTTVFPHFTSVDNTTKEIQPQSNSTIEPLLTPKMSSSSDNKTLLNKIRDSLKSLITTEKSDDVVNNTDTPKELCPKIPPDLGPVPVNTSDISLAWVEQQFPWVSSGGWYVPTTCKARHKVAIIIPFRDREQHLAIFLNHMHPFLMKQQIEYRIFIIEQAGSNNFNRAKLMNVGFEVSQKERKGGWDCHVFHDIDLLPLDTRNLYTCPKQPRHMSIAIDKWQYKLPYVDIFGGVSALTVKQFTDVNGFSNQYWGWGGEDDDMQRRIKEKKYHIARYPMSIGRYIMMHHKKQAVNPNRYELLAKTNKVFRNDGLSSLKFETIKKTYHHLYTQVLVNIDERS